MSRQPGPGEDANRRTCKSRYTILGHLADALTDEVAEIVDAWLASFSATTAKAYASDLRQWLAFLAEREVPFLAARRIHLDAWHRAMRDHADLSSATVSRRLASMSSLYGRLVEEEVLDRNPATGLRRPKPSPAARRGALHVNEVRALLDGAAARDKRLHALVAVLTLTGCRLSEPLSANIEDLDEENGVTTLRVRRKGGAYQRLPLPSTAAAALTGYLAGRSSGPLFLARTGRRWSARSAWAAFRKLSAEALPHRRVPPSPHWLRHAAITAQAGLGAPIDEIAAAHGHKSVVTTTSVYLHRSSDMRTHPNHLLESWLQQRT